MLRPSLITLFVALAFTAYASCSSTTDTSPMDAAGADDGTGHADSDNSALPDGACRTDDDCESGTLCNYPGPITGCGICYTPEVPNPDATPDEPMPTLCGTDADCESGTICQPDPCLCEGGGWCVAGCDVAGCEDWQDCGDDNRCTAKACTSGGDCPARYSCLAGDEGDTCQRTPCATDGDCDGTCVLGTCWPEPGECRGPIA